MAGSQLQRDPEPAQEGPTDSRATTVSIPGELDSHGGKLVYFFLDVHGGATVAELHRALNVSKLSLFGILESLADHGAVERREEAYVLAD